MTLLELKTIALIQYVATTQRACVLSLERLADDTTLAGRHCTQAITTCKHSIYELECVAKSLLDKIEEKDITP